jgi:hypothetical protein
MTEYRNPFFPPLPTGRRALEKRGITPLWQRGARGDFTNDYVFSTMDSSIILVSASGYFLSE